MEEFWADPALSTCKSCGHRITKPEPKVAKPAGGCGPGCRCG
jgi:hypothetical protein